MKQPLTAIEIRNQFLKDEKSAEEITQFYLNRIDSLNPKVQAFLSVFHDRALAKAKALDVKKANGEKVGKLAGIPIAIKDNIHVQGELTTCASKFLTNFKAPFASTAVKLLEEEDAIIIGKTNLDEFAMGSSTENSALQRTFNPWNLDRVPGGSSGGSAAAVAARMVPVSLGSDTGGSIRQPASFCGIVGFKPTYGRVSRFGLVAFGSSLDQIGPFGTNVADTSLIMEVIGRHCDRDSTSLAAPPESLVSDLDQNGKALKIGVPFEFLKGLEGEPKQLFDRALETWKELGAEIVDVDLNTLKHSIAVYYILATAEASTNLARFDGVRYGVRSPRAQTLEEVYFFSKNEGFGEEVKRRILLGTFVLSAGYQDAYYKKAQKIRTLMIENFRDAFKNCDLIAFPTTPSEAFGFDAHKDPLQMYLEDIYTIAVNLVGLPAVSLPHGFTKNGLPLGLQLIGPQLHDKKVLQAAYSFEQATDYHKQMPELAK